MKTKTALLIALALLFSCLAGFTPAVHAETGEARLGLGLVTDVTGSTSATETEDGRAKVDTTAVAVLLDADDTIIDVKIDIVQPYSFFDSAGVVVETKDFMTKRELGDDYGMVNASPIGKEWYEQASALEDYWIGKTVAEALAMEVDEEVRPTDEDLIASVTVHVDTFLLALEKAAATAEAVGSKTSDRIGLGITANNKRSGNATEDAEGLTQAYLHVAALSVGEDGLISAAIIDGLQANIKFDMEGQITSDLEAEVKSKNELGDEYGMRAASGIDAEWFEQAKAFAAYLVGKTAADVEGLAVEEGKTTDKDLSASVTISVTDMQAVAVKAYNDALGAKAVEGKAVKTGLGIVTNISGSTSADGETAGRAKVDSTVVGVMLDENDIVLDVIIDVIQPYTEWDAEGVVSELKSYSSKLELGDDYGMKAASEIGAEWYEQSESLSAYWTGKTVEEVLAMELNDDNAPADQDLAASVTVSVNVYLTAFKEAVEAAAEHGAESTDTLTLAIIADNNRSKDVAEDADGLAEAYIHYGLFTFDQEAKVTSAVIDAVQARVNFDGEGQITSDLVEDVTTKVELGADYGMVVASEIGKEWYEQIDAFEAFIVGKTAEEVNELADEDGKAADEDLVASVTITITALQQLVSEAAEQLSDVEAPVNPEEEPTEPEAEGAKTGLAVMRDVSGSTSADGETDGRAKTDITVVAVLVAEDGTIADVKLDIVQPYTFFDAEGKIVETKSFMTKRELGYEYGMLQASAIEKEWFEQASAFEAFVRGKSLEDVLAMELDDEHRPADEDLKASVTVHVDAYLAALEKAVNNAVASGAEATDELGLGIVATNMRSKDADGETDGQTEAYVHYAAVTFNADGVVTSAILDANQPKVSFDAEGQITSDLEAEQPTKLELGADYGMVAASEIGKEWNEQAEALALHVVGKNVEEILTLADDEGAVADEDLVASVTISIDTMLETIHKAYQDASVVAE